MIKKHIAVLAGCTALLFGPLVLVASAKPIFAKKEKKPCAFCHIKTAGSGARSFRGLYYDANKYSLKGFNEKTQAALAGVKPNSVGRASRPTKPYPPKKK